MAPTKQQIDDSILETFLEDWAPLRWLMRKLQKELLDVYNLTDVGIRE